ncbi:MAG: hypothetical protein WAS07_06595 [Micropruina sp.]
MEAQRAQLLTTFGQTRTNLSRQVRAGELVRVRHGAYAAVLDETTEGRHRQLLAATWPLLGERSVVSHASAGVLHGLPSWSAMLNRVSIVRPDGGHGAQRDCLHVRLAQVEADEVIEIDGYRVTSLARTAVDLGCVLSHERAVAIMDAALRLGMEPSQLATALAAARGRRGIGVARAAAKFADVRSESVGESISRVRFVQAGLPIPELQVEIHDLRGIWIARSDFGWRDRGVVGEFDGRVKYTGTPEQVAEVVMREKAREQAIRDAGWWVVRWGWKELGDLAAFRRRIETALARPNR